MRSRALVGMAGSLLTVGTIIACSHRESDEYAYEPPVDVAAVGTRLDGEFAGSSVRVTGARSPFADPIYACTNAVSACLNLQSDGTTDILTGMCPSDDTPTGTWTFSYEFFSSPNCAGSPLPDFECTTSEDETLPAGAITTNHVTCAWTSDAGVTDAASDTGVTDADGTDAASDAASDAGSCTPSYSGSANAFSALAVSFPVGPLPPTGGSLSNTQIGVSLPALGTAGVLSGATSGSGSHADSSASVSGLDINILGVIGVTATTLASESHAMCPAAASASSTITKLVLHTLLGPIPITANGTPNQVVLGLPVGVSLILNEQTITTVGNTAQATVTAAHLNVLGQNILIAQSHSDIVCCVP